MGLDNTGLESPLESDTWRRPNLIYSCFWLPIDAHRRNVLSVGPKNGKSLVLGAVEVNTCANS